MSLKLQWKTISVSWWEKLWKNKNKDEDESDKQKQKPTKKNEFNLRAQRHIKNMNVDVSLEYLRNVT